MSKKFYFSNVAKKKHMAVLHTVNKKGSKVVKSEKTDKVTDAVAEPTVSTDKKESTTKKTSAKGTTKATKVADKESKIAKEEISPSEDEKAGDE